MPRASALYLDHPGASSIRAAPRRRPRCRCASSTRPTRRIPGVQLLSNGRYHVMVTNAGGGYSRWKDLAVTRWREDAHLRPLGHVLLPARRRRAARSGRPPSSRRWRAPRATRRSSPSSASSSAAATRTSTRTPRSSSRPRTTSSCAACASPTAAARARTIEVTSYAEVVLAPAAADALHPGVQQPVRADRDRARAPGDPVHAPAALARRARRRGCCT